MDEAHGDRLDALAHELCQHCGRGYLVERQLDVAVLVHALDYFAPETS